LEPIIFVPLYYVAMLESIIIVIETPFVSTPSHIVDGVKSRTQTPIAT